MLVVRAASIRFPIEPRMIPAAKVARRLGVPEREFLEKVPALIAAGFPRADAVLGTYCLEAVDRWIDERAGLLRSDDPVSAQSAMLRAVRERAWAK